MLARGEPPAQLSDLENVPGLATIWPLDPGPGQGQGTWLALRSTTASRWTQAIVQDRVQEVFEHPSQVTNLCRNCFVFWL